MLAVLHLAAIRSRHLGCPNTQPRTGPRVHHLGGLVFLGLVCSCSPGPVPGEPSILSSLGYGHHMSLRSRVEAQLISALINNTDALRAQQFGVIPEMFQARQAEYRWVLDYQQAYGQCPSAGTIQHKFPGFTYQAECTDLPFYIEELIHNYNERRLVKTIKDAAVYVADGDFDEALLTLGAYTQAKVSQPLPNALHNELFLDRYHDPVDVLAFPWKTLDDVTGGMRPGELYYLGARLGQGKSWTLASMVCNALMEGRRVMFYSLEMPEEQVLTRMHVILGKHLGFEVDHKAMRGRNFDLIQYRKLARAIKDEIPGELFLRDTSKGPISPLTLQGGQNAEVDLVVVDHCGLMHQPNGGRAVDDWRAMAVISNSLKEISISQNIRLLSAAQINREGDSNSKWPPKTKHLAQSDALGQDADCVITHKLWGRSTMCYSIEKTRDGQSEVPFWTTYEPNHGVFREIGRDEAVDRWEDEKDD